MKLARFGLFFAALAASPFALAVPTILILQERLPLKDKADPNVDIATFIGQELDNNGRLLPVVYSKTDPLFRAAMAGGKLKEPSASPKQKELFEVAHSLNAEYVLVLESGHSGRFVKAKAILFHNQKEVWKDDQSLAVTLKDSLDSTDTAKSIARTFVLKMNVEPFKSLQEHPKTASPTLQPGQEPVAPAPGTAVTASMTNVQLKKAVERLVQGNKVQSAIMLMRDAVDATPFDLERRMELIALLQTQSPAAAAFEARRAAILMPDKLELRVQAARAWIKAGQADEAQKDLNEAVARDPNGVPTRLLLGELSLQQLEPTKALGHLDEVIKQQDSAQARFLRALCRGLLGGVDGMQIDLAQADKLEPSRAPEDVARRYALAAELTDRSLAQDGAELRLLLAKIVVKPKDQALRDEIEQTQRLLLARTALLSSVPVPADAKQANDRRILAHKLMSQCVSDIQSYSNTPDEDMLVDARINLGESLKNLTALKADKA